MAWLEYNLLSTLKDNSVSKPLGENGYEGYMWPYVRLDVSGNMCDAFIEWSGLSHTTYYQSKSTRTKVSQNPARGTAASGKTKNFIGLSS